LVSVTLVTEAVVSFQPTITTLKFPARCAPVKTMGTLLLFDCGVA
jgi:hypothetical protein